LLDDRLVALPRYEAASHTASIANGLKKGSSWVLSASGGVIVHPWRFAGNVRQADDLQIVRTAARAGRDKHQAWWD